MIFTLRWSSLHVVPFYHTARHNSGPFELFLQKLVKQGRPLWVCQDLHVVPKFTHQRFDFVPTWQRTKHDACQLVFGGPFSLFCKCLGCMGSHLEGHALDAVDDAFTKQPGIRRF